LFLILLLAGSCQYTDKVKDSEPVKDSIGQAALAASGLTPKEFLHYHNACQRFFATILPGSSFNGSILVAKKGTILFEHYQGYSDPFLKQDTLDPKTAFHLASVSKTFTAMATLKLWEQGKLGLDDSLNKYFPDFPYNGITIKMLLSHRSGIPNYLHYLDHYKWDKRKMVTNADVLKSLYDYRPRLDFTSGKRFAYCNTNYVLLALVIEKVSGMSFKMFLESTFFRPLQMNDTYVFTPQDVARSLPSFEWNNKRFPYEFLDIVYGDKNIYSTVRDMLKWDQALYAGKLFARNTLDSAFAPYSFEKSGIRNYGLGWRMTLLPNGKKMLYHNGWWHGNNTVFIRLVDEEAMIVVLSNKFNRNVYSTKNICNLFGNYMQNAEFEE
jgi:CubicO group peptidase (beta-lactamase class C family)